MTSWDYLVSADLIDSAVKILNTHGDSLGECRDVLRSIVAHAKGEVYFADAATQLVVNFDTLTVSGVDDNGLLSLWSHTYATPEALLAELPMLWQDYVVDYRTEE